MFEELNLQEKLKLYADLLKKPLPLSNADMDKLNLLRRDPEILDRDISKAEERLAAIKAEEPMALKPGLPQTPSNQTLYNAKDRGQLKSLKMHYLYLRDKIESSTRQLFYDERAAAALRWAFSKLSPETLKDLPKFRGFEQQELCEDEGCPNSDRLHVCRDLQAEWEPERKQRGWSAEAVRFTKAVMLKSLNNGEGNVTDLFTAVLETNGCNDDDCTITECAIALGQMIQDGSLRVKDGLIVKGKARKRKAE